MKKILILIIGFSLSWNALFAQTITDEDTYLEIYQIKVSTGHATLVVTKSKSDSTKIYKSVLIDAGNTNKDASLIAELILKPEVANGKLDVVMVTHHDKDHWGGLPIKTTGLLEKRCSNNGSLKSQNSGYLQLYMSIKGDNTPTSKEMKKDTLEARFNDKVLRINHWDRELSIDLIPITCKNVDTIKINTLAINGYRRDDKFDKLSLGVDGVKKNNSSGVLTITRGAFSFLIQGDLFSSITTNGGEILKTTTDYRQEDSGKRFPTTYNANPVPADGQNAITFTKDDSLKHSNTYFVRKNLTSNKNKRKRDEDSNIIQRALKHWVANPSEWHHKLGTTINNHNGTVNKYGHTCVALVPHHGALTSSHWFNTSHAIIGSNYNNGYGHPNINAIQSLYNTSGVKNFYITYLLDNEKYQRLTEMNNLMSSDYTPTAQEPGSNTEGTNRYMPGASVYFLDGGNNYNDENEQLRADNKLFGPKGSIGVNNLSYYKFTVNNNSQFKIETETEVLRDWAICGDH